MRRSRPQTPPGMEVIEPAALEVLREHHWPGNVRELANCIEHALVLCDGLPLTAEHLPARLGASRGRAQPVAPAAPPTTGPGRETRPASLREIEMQAILDGLERNHGNKPKTAEELGISLKTLYNKLHQLHGASQDSSRDSSRESSLNASLDASLGASPEEASPRDVA